MIQWCDTLQCTGISTVDHAVLNNIVKEYNTTVDYTLGAQTVVQKFQNTTCTPGSTGMQGKSSLSYNTDH